MKYKIWLFSILVTLGLVMSQVFTASSGIDIWTSCGPEGGIIRALVINPATPSIVYAGTSYGGVFKSTNGGAPWSIANTGLRGTVIFALAIDLATPNILCAGLADVGVVKSTRTAFTWRWCCEPSPN